MGGLRYEVHRMPPGMREKVVAQVLAKVQIRAADPHKKELEEIDPCFDCPRWWECNGVDEMCPFK